METNSSKHPSQYMRKRIQNYSHKYERISNKLQTKMELKKTLDTTKVKKKRK